MSKFFAALSLSVLHNNFDNSTKYYSHSRDNVNINFLTLYRGKQKDGTKFD